MPALALSFYIKNYLNINSNYILEYNGDNDYLKMYPQVYDDYFFSRYNFKI